MGSKEAQTWLDKLEEQRKPILHTYDWANTMNRS